MSVQVIRNLYLLSALFLLGACTGLKYVPEGKKLYTGADVEIKSEEDIRSKKQLRAEAERVIRPKPNSKFLGMRPKLWVYYITDGDSSRGFKKWLRTKLGEEPVYFENVTPSQTASFIDAAMFNNGIFKAVTTFEIKERKKTTSVDYLIMAHPPFRYNMIHWPADSSELSKALRASVSRSMLGKDEDYSLEVLRKERQRINDELKDRGYFYFRPEYIHFTADTQEVERRVNLEIGYDEEMPVFAARVCTIGQVTVNQYYTLRADSLSRKRDTTIVEGVIFTGYSRIRPKVLLRSIFLRVGETYSRKKHLTTLSRLSGLNNFQFVSVDFDTSGGTPQVLDTEVRLTPSRKRTVRIELRAVSKSNDFAGPGLNVSYRNRNSLNGAEQFTARVETSYERQFGGDLPNIYSFSVRPELELLIPRFVTPFKIREPKGFFIPQTRFVAGYEYMRRSKYYHLTSLDFSYGYRWKENIKKEHEFNPVFINFITLRNRSAEFDSLLETNPILSESFREQFIAGLNYTFTFNEQVLAEQRSQFYLQLKPETAGNFLQLLTGKQNSGTEGNKIAGAVFAQYFRMSADARNYFNYTSENKLVLRLMAGVGLPYGNSSTLPYNKQFFSGGPSSVRAFRLNSLGPGVYLNEDPLINRYVFTQGGEVKLEANVEYRFPIYKIVKGAVFTDAGNIWLINSNPSIDAPNFSFSNFPSALAVGAGFGIRFDATFFVLRFDLATPLRKPWLANGDKWVTDYIKPGDRDWRKDNLILNIAIGYPF
jgi:outer membrane protein assembly factor BamA